MKKNYKEKMESVKWTYARGARRFFSRENTTINGASRNRGPFVQACQPRFPVFPRGSRRRTGAPPGSQMWHSGINGADPAWSPSKRPLSPYIGQTTHKQRSPVASGARPRDDFYLLYLSVCLFFPISWFHCFFEGGCSSLLTLFLRPGNNVSQL